MRPWDLKSWVVVVYSFFLCLLDREMESSKEKKGDKMDERKRERVLYMPMKADTSQGKHSVCYFVNHEKRRRRRAAEMKAFLYRELLSLCDCSYS